MHSGPWAKLATVLFLAKKGVDAGRWAGGGKGGGLGGALGKATPTPVWVVNWGGKFAGPVGAAITAGELVHALFPSFGEKDAPSRAGGAAPRRQSERQIPAPGFGGGMPGALNITTQVVMDGRVVGQSTDTAKAREKARK
jgi:hypothetical protein